MGVLCFGFLLFALAFPLLLGVPFALAQFQSYLCLWKRLLPLSPPSPTDICVCAPRSTTWWFAWGVGSPLWHSHIDGGTTARPAARNLIFAQDGANLPENCDGACVLSGSSPFFHVLMPCLYCGMPNGISIIFESAKCARCEFFSCLFEHFLLSGGTKGA